MHSVVVILGLFGTIQYRPRYIMVVSPLWVVTRMGCPLSLSWPAPLKATRTHIDPDLGSDFLQPGHLEFWKMVLLRALQGSRKSLS